MTQMGCRATGSLMCKNLNPLPLLLPTYTYARVCVYIYIPTHARCAISQQGSTDEQWNIKKVSSLYPVSAGL